MERIVRRRARGTAYSLLTAFLLLSRPMTHSATADELQDFARQCDMAIGTTVPDFDCDAGTEVPGQGPVFSGNQTGVTCDEPNRLNRQCDPGSRFQVLTRTDDAYIVAHCRKEGGESGMYGDIAVIQYSRKNGATCFYQALGNQSHGNLPGGHTAPNAPANPVKAPSNGAVPNTFWLTPTSTVHVDHCGRCHDNGPFIRSPYINQVQGVNELPGARDFSFNRDPQPYSLVGQPFSAWKAYKVEISGNECNSCHRLAVNNIGFNDKESTALDFAIRATAPSEEAKNPPSDHSPIWMPPVPVQVAFDQAHAVSAKAIHDCALRLGENPLPNSDSCRITLFAQAYSPGSGGPGPHVTSVNPASAQCGGATNITIQGSNFSGATAVEADSLDTVFGPSLLLNVNVVSDSQITATVPNLRAGSYEIVVRTPLGSSVQPRLSNMTDFFAIGPTVTTISPNEGPVPGGTAVTITGSCFDSPGQDQKFVKVFFGGTEAGKGFDQCASSTQCMVSSPPASSAGQVVDVVVSVDGSQSTPTPAGRFTYVGPIITDLTPNHGPKTGGSSVLITGGGFPPYTGTGNNMAVAFGSAQTSALCLGSSVTATSSCSVMTPPVSNAGPVQVVATAFGESSPASSASVFTYEETPALTKFSMPDPDLGIQSVVSLNGNAPQGGAAVTITSSDPTIVQPSQAIVTISAGSQSAIVPFTFFPTRQDKQVTLTAGYLGGSLSGTIDIRAYPPLILATPTNLDVNESGTARVTISTRAPAPGATIALSSSDPAAIELPPSNSVTIPGGSYNTSFSITDRYSGKPKSVQIFGTYNGASASSSVLVPSATQCVPRKCRPGFVWDPGACECVKF